MKKITDFAKWYAKKWTEIDSQTGDREYQKFGIVTVVIGVLIPWLFLLFASC